MSDPALLKELRSKEVRAQMLLDKFVEESDLSAGNRFQLRRLVDSLVIAASKYYAASQT